MEELGLAYTLHKVVLKHAREEDLDVLLYQSRSDRGVRLRAETLSRLLKRPILREEVDGSFSERAVEDLDKSVRELVEEGSLRIRKLNGASKIAEVGVHAEDSFGVPHRPDEPLGPSPEFRSVVQRSGLPAYLYV